MRGSTTMIRLVGGTMTEPATYLYIDFETTVTKDLTLRTMTKRQYLTDPRCEVLMLGWAADDGPVQVTRPSDPGWEGVVQRIRDAQCIVAHNASFDVAVLVLKLGLRWPVKIHCTKELAHAWTPNQPGGYSLKNLASVWFDKDLQKLDIDLATASIEDMLSYCRQDVEVCRALHKIALTRLHPQELRIAEATMAAKEVSFIVDPRRAADAYQAFDTICRTEAAAVSAMLTSEDMFGVEDDGAIRSVKPHILKRRLLEDLGFDAQSISLKKLNPEKLRGAPEAAAVLRHTAEANKALSHRRRVGRFRFVDRVDCELTYYAAHTGRFSSKVAVGKGLNLQNLPKRNPLIAKPIREMYRLDPELCFVRGDFANVEYRIEGWLTDCQYVLDMFLGNVNADPYIAFWLAATGQQIDKKHPARQIAKAAVLGLGFGMGIHRWIEELLRAVADPTFGVSLDDLDRVCREQNWTMPKDRYARAAMTKLSAPWQVAAVAYETREKFHALHAEFFRVARWLERSVARLTATANIARVLELVYEDPAAPDRNKIELGVDEWIQGRSVTVRLGGWPTPTVVWRDLAIRNTPLGPGLTYASGSKGYRKVTMQLLIENITQSCARNALCKGVLALNDLGYPYVLNVHDEIQPIVPRRIDAVLEARQCMIDVFGPGNTLGYDWAVLIRPGEITITQSLWEDEALCAALWRRIEAGDTTALQELP